MLGPLRAEGWRLRHSLRWQGSRDIDSIAISPTGVGTIIETKTRSYDERHLNRVRAPKLCLSRRRRRRCRNAVVAVIASPADAGLSALTRA
jgi:hypothetical protein